MNDNQRVIDANRAIDEHSAMCEFCKQPDTVNELGCPIKGRLYAEFEAAYLAQIESAKKSR